MHCNLFGGTECCVLWSFCWINSYRSFFNDGVNVVGHLIVLLLKHVTWEIVHLSLPLIQFNYTIVFVWCLFAIGLKLSIVINKTKRGMFLSSPNERFKTFCQRLAVVCTVFILSWIVEHVFLCRLWLMLQFCSPFFTCQQYKVQFFFIVCSGLYTECTKH
jgi:hypothetical protein